MNILTPSASTLVSSSVAPSSYAAWSSATAYTVGQKVLYTDKREYECKVANTNKPPATENAYWTLLGTSNRYKMFDQFLYSQTVSTDTTLSVTLDAFGAQGIYFSNLEASNIFISIVDLASSQIIEEKNFDLYGEIGSWDAYFFFDFESVDTSLLFLRETLFLDVRISIIITADTIAKCGQLILGKISHIGNTKWQPSISMLDYSIIEADPDTGEVYIQKGKNTKEIDYTISCPTAQTYAVFNMLSRICGAPAVFYHGAGFGILTLYGYPTKAEIILENSVESILNLNIKGLI